MAALKVSRIHLLATFVNEGVIQVIDNAGNIRQYAQRGIHKLSNAEATHAIELGLLCGRAFDLKELPLDYSIRFECPETMGRAIASFNKTKLYR